jgi:hypothetical protein
MQRLEALAEERIGEGRAEQARIERVVGTRVKPSADDRAPSFEMRNSYRPAQRKKTTSSVRIAVRSQGARADVVAKRRPSSNIDPNWPSVPSRKATSPYHGTTGVTYGSDQALRTRMP